MSVSIARVAFPEGRRWVMFDPARRLRGFEGESKAALIARWIEAYGKPEGLGRFKGIMRPSEFAMTVADCVLGDD